MDDWIAYDQRECRSDRKMRPESYLRTAGESTRDGDGDDSAGARGEDRDKRFERPESRADRIHCFDIAEAHISPAREDDDGAERADQKRDTPSGEPTRATRDRERRGENRRGQGDRIEEQARACIRAAGDDEGDARDAARSAREPGP